MQCAVSKRAAAVIRYELSRFPDTETGGLLLGYSRQGKDILVLEATDSGYRNVIHEPSCFRYDAAYEEHLCNLLSHLYRPPLQLVGVWHKHNFVYSGTEIPFSRADERMHRQLMENENPCISVLFEKDGKEKADICYKTSVYLLAADGNHRNITDSAIFGDAGFDEKFILNS